MMSITQQELGRRIRVAREACRMAQADAAKYIGVPHPTFVEIEAGTRPISGLELDRLAYVFGRDLREFVAGSFGEQPVTPCVQVDAGARPEALEGLRASIAIEHELRNLERLVGIDPAPLVNEPRDRLLELAIEAFSQDQISRRKLCELASMVGLAGSDLDRLIDDAGVDG